MSLAVEVDPAKCGSQSNADRLREEYELTANQLREGSRGEYAERFSPGVNIVRLDPDVAAVFPDSESLNEALRPLAEIIPRSERRSA